MADDVRHVLALLFLTCLTSMTPRYFPFKTQRNLLPPLAEKAISSLTGVCVTEEEMERHMEGFYCGQC